jgi:hypothetical protein
MPTLALPTPPVYFPMAHGRYDTTAGLKPLGDRLHYQIDDQYPAFMRAKEVSRVRGPSSTTACWVSPPGWTFRRSW